MGDVNGPLGQAVFEQGIVELDQASRTGRYHQIGPAGTDTIGLFLGDFQGQIIVGHAERPAHAATTVGLGHFHVLDVC